MDILHLIDRLEALVEDSFHLPFTSNVIVQEDAFLDIIDQMRVTIPEEVKLAKLLQIPLFEYKKNDNEDKH